MTTTTKTAKSYNEAMELVKEFHAKRPDCYFVYDSENYGESRKNNTIYRFFDGMGKDGYGICFAMIEIVKDGKLETVRVINTYRDTTVDIKIEIEPETTTVEAEEPVGELLKAHRAYFNWLGKGKPVYCCYDKTPELDGSEEDAEEEFTFNVMPAEDNDVDDELVDEPDIAPDVTIEVTPEGDIYATQIIGEETLITCNGKVHNVSNDRLGAHYSALPTPHFSFKVPDGKWHKFKGYEVGDPEVINILLQRADGSTVELADNFTAELAKLEAAKLEAEAKEQAAKAVYEAARAETDKHQVKIRNFLDSHASRLCNKLQALAPTERMTLITIRGTREFCRDFTDLYVDAPDYSSERRFAITYYNGRELASYDTPAQVEAVINMLKSTIKRGEKIFTFPTVEQLTVSVELEIIKARKHEVVIELCELRAALEETGADEETPQRHIDYLKDRIESLTAEYDELWDKLFALKNQKGVA